MKDYVTAVKFERAGQVIRLLELAGKQFSREDILYLNHLGHMLENSKAAMILEPWQRESQEWRDV